MPAADTIVYNASKTGTQFHADQSFVRLIMGPIGSGKSVTCIEDMLMKVLQQAPFEYKGRLVRASRWAVIRNTYRELLDTTVKSFFDWVPVEFGRWIKQDVTFYMSLELPDNTIVEAEFLFRALDRPGDVKKLLSLELTGAFLNESKEIPKAVFDMAQGRVGRYPSKRKGGPSWYGIVLDTNPPDSDSWIHRIFEEDKPEGYSIYHQPSGTSPEAENIENLPEGYYTRLVHGKTKEWVNVYVDGKYGFVSDGKPVYPEYIDALHYSDAKVRPIEGTTIYVGLDFGLTPAAVIGQEQNGTFIILEELVTFDMGAVNFGKLLKLRLAKYKKFDIEIWGDPAGDQRAQTDEDTPYRVLDKLGLNALPTMTNDPVIRREVVAGMLSELVNGKPRLMISSGAPTLRKGFNGGYKYKRLQVVGEERFVETPDKNKFSHIHDALQYMMLGAIGDDGVIGTFSKQELNYKATNRMIV